MFDHESLPMPLAIKHCLTSSECRGYKVDVVNTKSKRVGNAFMDILNFKRVTEKTGWSFTALLIIHDGILVYKIWSGVPNIETKKHRSNPLGPLQDSGKAIGDLIL